MTVKKVGVYNATRHARQHVHVFISFAVACAAIDLLSDDDDAGPTIITLPYLIEELFTLCGKKMKDHVDLRLMSPFYRIRFDDGTHFDYSNDKQAMLAEVAKLKDQESSAFMDKS